MVKTDKKSKQAEKKLRVAQKKDKKANKKEKKGKAKGKDDSDAEDIDLDAVLAEYAKQQEQFLQVVLTVCDPPSSRSSSTIIASPANSNEIFLFGGESFSGGLAKFFNDLFVYNINRDEWKLITSPNSPLPRSGHAWCRGGNTGGIYLFGGEFSSPKQGTFYHYNDFWCLDDTTREWSKIETKGKGPPARSGHRMTYFKNYIIIFGGFQDTSQQTKYLQDIWIYDCKTNTWHSPALPPASQKPDARSSFSFLPHESGAVIYGGYSRVKTAVTSNKQQKGGGPSSRAIVKPLVHQDTWFLRILQPPPEAAANTGPTIRWERRKRPANQPNPPRAGATMAYHKGRGIQFGGVHDVEEDEEGIESEFFNTLYVWNIERNRYFPLALRRPRTANRKQVQIAEKGKRGRGKADEDELLRNLAALETGASLSEAQNLELDSKEPEDNALRPEKTTSWEMPHPRFNAQLTVQDDILYIFGGTFEKDDHEYTFDEMVSIDLGKLDGVKEIFKREMEGWQDSEDEDTDEDDGEEDDENDEHSSDDEEDHSSVHTEMSIFSSDKNTEHLGSRSPLSVSTAPTDIDEENVTDDTIAEKLPISDDKPHPRAFESLRDYFARTSALWQEMLLEDLTKRINIIEDRSIKEIRKLAFERAEEKWWDCREEIQALEDEQESAGIGEVVNLGDRATDSTGLVGRRR